MSLATRVDFRARVGRSKELREELQEFEIQKCGCAEVTSASSAVSWWLEQCMERDWFGNCCLCPAVGQTGWLPPSFLTAGH